MTTGRRLRRLGATVALGGIACLGFPGLTSTAAADTIPPFEPDCGLVYHEAGLLSKTIHSIEPALAGLRLNLTVHDLNCSVVVSLETQIGLQPKPGFPGGPFG